MDRIDQAIDRHPEVAAKWRAFMDSDSHLEAFEDMHFVSLSLGFFLGAGVPLQDASLMSIRWDNL